MARFLCWFLPRHSRKLSTFFLAFIWIIGLCCGVAMCFYADDSIFSLMRSAVTSSVSIVNLLAVSLLPFLFSAYFVYIHGERFFSLLCFIKGCLFGFVSAAVYAGFGSAGWLLRLIFLFSDSICLVLLWLFWIHYGNSIQRFSANDVAVFALAVCLIVSLDYYYVSPYMVKLLDF